MSEEEEHCNNCKKSIPSTNFVVHEAGCKRRTKGNGHVQRSAEEKKVVCDLSKMKVENNVLEHHKAAECMSKPKNDAFCELQVPQCDLPDHERRTESSYIQNDSDNQSVGASSLDKHGDELRNNTPDRTRKNTTNRKSEVNRQNDDYLLSVDTVPVIPESSSEKSSESPQDYEIVKQVQKAVSRGKDEIDFKRKKYIGHMPWELKYGYKDAVILCSENDLPEVEKFKKCLETKIVLHGGERPKIALLHEIEVTQRNKFKALEFALDRCTFVFLFITSSFVTDEWARFSSQTSLMESIENYDKSWSVVPVLTDNRGNKYKKPIIINTLKGVTYCSGNDLYVESIRKLFEDRISVRKEREREEGTMQRAWLFQYEKDMHEKEIREKQEQLKDRARLEELKQHKATLDHSLSMPVIAPSSDLVPEGASRYQRSKSFMGPNSTDQMLLESFVQGSEVSPQFTCVRPAAEHTEPASGKLEELLKQKSTLVCNPASSKDDKFPVESAASIEYESFAADEEKDENANVTEDSPTASGAGSSGCSKMNDKKVLQYVQTIHHHHHHGVKNYNVKADIVQLGQTNNVVMKRRVESYSENQQYSEEMDDEEDDRTDEEESS
ncbi:uncharacterized protein LOC126819700 [Patella vulgata]|uniref:uncharacterized protein LOC126819700 n=1 Tax=Patella vulgata TaxID=6465 RepID=UPI0024A9B209|nr:uncharacterized protein LOC126819700 [Patella vulgata]